MSKPLFLNIMEKKIGDIDHDINLICDEIYETLHLPEAKDRLNMPPEFFPRLIKNVQNVLAIIAQIKKLQETIDVLETKQFDIKNAYKTYCEKQDGEINVYEIEEFDSLYTEVKGLLNFLTQLSLAWPELTSTRKEVKQDGIR